MWGGRPDLFFSTLIFHLTHSVYIALDLNKGHTVKSIGCPKALFGKRDTHSLRAARRAKMYAVSKNKNLMSNLREGIIIKKLANHYTRGQSIRRYADGMR
jgi:hypothetical protein